LGSRYFISYSRRSEEDGKLADELCTGLNKAGHEVFIDVDMSVGTDWIAEIERRIEWCDFLIVLLSEASIHSEMMRGEVRMAHRKRQPDGRPHILPIRVRYELALDYELDSYLARVQYVRWSGGSDTARVITDILRTADRAPLPPQSNSEPSPADAHPGHPEPSVLAYTLREPTGVIRLSDTFYVRRTADRDLDALAQDLGQTVFINASRQTGGSSLLRRYLAACAATGKAIGFVNLDPALEDDLDGLQRSLAFVARTLLQSLTLAQPHDRTFNNPTDLTTFIQDHILRSLKTPLVLAFEEIDRLVGRNYQNAFFAMLRVWNDKRTQPGAQSLWEDVDIVCVCRIPPYLLITDPGISPLNFAKIVRVGNFTITEVHDLNKRYGTILEADAIDKLYTLLRGHPYLTRLAFYRLVAKQVSTYNALHDTAHKFDGPFSDHLRALVFRLKQNNLLSAMQQAVLGHLHADELKYQYLHSEGLVVYDEMRVVPSNLLYDRFFRGLW
jgi:hypothetical protein